MFLLKRHELTAEYLRSRLHYDPESGIFTWLPVVGNTKSAQVFNGKCAGRRAGSIGPKGYVNIKINKIKCYAHVLAWLYMTGEWPEHEVDHRDRCRSNNAFRNLREATESQSMWNTGIRSDNTSGHKGVYWHGQAERWGAAIASAGKRVYLGLFDTKEAAAAAYRSASLERHGEFSIFG